MVYLQKKKGFICDMDGVIYHGNNLLPGVKEFVDWLTREKKNYLSSLHRGRQVEVSTNELSATVHQADGFCNLLQIIGGVRGIHPGNL